MEEYASFVSFVKENRELSVEDFYSSLSLGMNLFSTGEDFDFALVDQTLETINKSLGAVKRIFRKPIIELEEEDKIVPVEAAGRIDSKSVSHLSSHPELWDKIENDELTPRQLLSKTYQDNYAFYENLVVVSYVDHILSFIRKKKETLMNLLYSSRSLNINLLDRDNHPNYYQGLEMLQRGYLDHYTEFSFKAQ